MIDKIVSKLSNPSKIEDEVCQSEERAVEIVADIIKNISEYEVMDLESIVQEIKTIIDLKHSSENLDFEIVIDDTYSKLKVSSSILRVLLDLLNNSFMAFHDEEGRKKVKLQFICNEYGLEIECCDNARVLDQTKENQKRDATLFVSREIIKKIFVGKMDPSSREYSRSDIHPVDNSDKTCFYVALPYSSHCILKAGYE